MKISEIFIGKPLHWLLWIIIVTLLYLVGSMSFHVKQFVPFILLMIVIASASVAVIVFSYRKGERITREPFEE